MPLLCSVSISCQPDLRIIVLGWRGASLPHRAWSSLARAAQEQMWVAVGDSVFRERLRLSDAASRLMASPGRRGSLVWTFNRPGDFEFACLVAGHFEAGMVGRLNVKGK